MIKCVSFAKNSFVFEFVFCFLFFPRKKIINGLIPGKRLMFAIHFYLTLHSGSCFFIIKLKHRIFNRLTSEKGMFDEIWNENVLIIEHFI